MGHFSDHAVFGTGVTMEGAVGVLAAALIFAAAVSATYGMRRVESKAVGGCEKDVVIGRPWPCP